MTFGAKMLTSELHLTSQNIIYLCMYGLPVSPLFCILRASLARGFKCVSLQLFGGIRFPFRLMRSSKLPQIVILAFSFWKKAQPHRALRVSYFPGKIEGDTA